MQNKSKIMSHIFGQIILVLCASLMSTIVYGKNVKTLSHMGIWQLENLAQDVCWDLSLYLNGVSFYRFFFNFCYIILQTVYTFQVT